MSIDERLAKLEVSIEAQNKEIGRLSNEVNSLSQLLQSKLVANGKQEGIIESIREKQGGFNEEIDKIKKDIERLETEFRGDIKTLMTKVYWIIGLLAGANGVFELLSRYLK